MFAFADAVGTSVASEKAEDDPWATPAEEDAAGAGQGLVEPTALPGARGSDPLLEGDGGLAIQR